MKLEAVMILFHTNGKKILETKTFQYDGIEIIEDFSEHPDLVLGIENEEKVFVGKSHFRKKNKLAMYNLAFRLIPEYDYQKIDDFTIKYSAKKETEKHELYYDPNYQLFFDFPSIKVNKMKWNYSNDINKIAIGSTNAGVFYITIESKETKIAIHEQPYRICILPSSLPYEQYKSMLKEILDIRRELIISSKGGKQSVQLEWQSALSNLMENINVLEKVLKKIAKNPKTTFIETLSKIPKNKIKKYNGKTIIEFYKSNGAINSISIDKQESIDIYENRMIKYALTKILDFVNAHSHYICNEIDKEQVELEDNINRLLTAHGAESIEELEDIVKNFGQKKLIYFNRNIHRLEEYDISEPTMDIELYMNVNADVPYHCQFVNQQFQSLFNIRGYLNPDINRFALDYKSQNGKHHTYLNLDEDRLPYTISGRKATIQFTSSDVSKHALLHWYLYSCNKPCVIKIHAKVLKNNYNESDALRAGQTKKNDGGVYPGTFDYPLKIVELYSINENTSCEQFNILQPYEYIRSIYKESGRLLLGEELINEIESLLLKQKILDEKIKIAARNNNSLEKIVKKINNLLLIDFIKNTPLRKEYWKVSQIFTNDKDYKKIYKCLREIDKKYEITDEFNAKDLLIRKTDELYEYWILIKMCKLFIDSGWEIPNYFSLKMYIHSWLRKVKKAQLETIEIPFVFKLDSPTIITESNLSPLLNRVLDQTYFKKIELKIIFNKEIGGKLPDYQLNFDIYDARNQIIDNKIFYLDAKYRNYEEQKGKEAWYQDINDVAINKYINFFVENGTKSDGAFIVHTDEHEKYTYFGDHMTHEMKENIEPILIKKTTNSYYSNNFFLESKFESDRNPDHRFGSFSCTPENVQHLKTFIKMLIEYKFIEKGTPFVCFECGNTKPSIETKYTANGKNIKYHLKCQSCGEFWVRNHCESNGHLLVKHISENYHSQVYPNYLWYVKCPKCDLI